MVLQIMFYYGNVVAGTVFKDIADRVYATSLEMMDERVEKVPDSGVLPYSKGWNKRRFAYSF